MSQKFDILIVGAGLFGATCAYELRRKGFSCLVVDRRSHIGGNCFTEQKDGINIHKYGPHIFHTSNRSIWNWINQFATFNSYRHRPKVNFNGRIFSFPINLFTLHQLWGVTSPAEAEAKLADVRIQVESTASAEDWILSQVGSEIYEAFIKGYTQKQWGRSPSELPASIVKRLPIRLVYDDSYFDDEFQGIPIGGYTQIFSKLLSNIELRPNTDYFESREIFDSMCERILFTGPIDRFFEYCFGRLEYRSLRFEHERLGIPDYQGVSMMHFTSAAVPFTRIVEHKHFEFGRQPMTWVTREYPVPSSATAEPMYPVRDNKNLETLRQYQEFSRLPRWQKYHFGGRLAEYQYYDMHQVIASALRKAVEIERELAFPRECRRKPSHRDVRPELLSQPAM